MAEAQEVLMEGVRIIFRNFEGKEGPYNRLGDRNFCVVLPPDVAVQMEDDGWNVKWLQARDEEEDNTPYLLVSVKYGKGRPPRVVMITSRGRTNLDEEDLEILDWADISNVDLIVRPYHWTLNEKSGIKAYLKSIYITINEDELELKYADIEETNPIGTREDV